MHDNRPSSSFRRVKKFSVCFDSNFTKGKISSVGWRDNFALPVQEFKLEAKDLCEDEFHRRKQLAKITVNKFIELGFITSEEIVENLMDKHRIHPFKLIAVGTMYNRKEGVAK